MSLIDLVDRYGIKILGIHPKNKGKNITTASGSMSLKQIREIIKENAVGDDLTKARDFNFENSLLVEINLLEENKKNSPQNESTSRLLSGTILYQDASFTYDREPRFFLGTTSGRVSKLPAHIFINHYEISEPQKVAIPAIPEYSPHGDFGEYEKKIVSGENIIHVNTYIPPDWRDYAGDLPDELPKDFQKLINHIFPKQIDRDYFFHWVYRSLTFRAETYLILQGDGGIGKNRLKIALRALHGGNNSADGKRSTITGNFNSQLADNTLLYFDEFKFTEKEENVMKEIPNNTISIEGKFKDSTKNTKVFCSLVIANNKEKDNFILYDARKFTPLELTKENLNTAMTNEEISSMSAKMEFEDSPTFDLKYVAQIGRWILKHGEDPRWPTCEYKGPRFWAMAHTSSAEWKKLLLSTIFSKNPTIVTWIKDGTLQYSLLQKEHLKELKKMGAPAPRVDFSNVEHFLNQYRDLEGNKIFSTQSIPDDLRGDFKIQIIRRPVLFINNSQKVEERPEDLL